MSTDNLSNMISTIRNGQLSRKVTVEHPVSYNNIRVLDILTHEGFINGYSLSLDESNLKKTATISLKYHNNKPVIQEIKRISKSGKRIYTGIKQLRNTKDLTSNFKKSGIFRKTNYSPNDINNQEICLYILSTSIGIISSKTACIAGVGGEVLIKVS